MALRRCLALRRRGIAAVIGESYPSLGTAVIGELGSGSQHCRFADVLGATRRSFSSSTSPSTSVEALLCRKPALLHRRCLATESLSERWKFTSERVKQAVVGKPKAVMESLKHSEVMQSTKGAVSSLSRPLSKTVLSYREALKLQIEAFWRRNYLVVVGAVGLAACLLLWRVMFGIASMFVSLSEGMAKYGFLALAASMVAFGGMLLKARYTVNPDAVYRIAMRRLNTSAEVLKALGAPLSGTDIRAYVMTGGGIRIKEFKPRLSNKRCFLIFPIQGSERKGLVSIEAKKKNGQHEFKLLAVDVAGKEGRIYVVGDEVEYKVGGGLIAELRDPIVKAMESQSEFEAQDDHEEAEQQHQEAAAAQR